MSFIDNINDLKTMLTNNVALQAFAQSKWSKSVTVKKMFKHRVEVGLEELPIIMITRPVKVNGTQEDQHSVNLYYGFLQDDREKAQDESVQFEEYIEAAVIANNEQNKLALLVQPDQSANDEGYYHPVYFGVKRLEITVAQT